MSKTTNTALSRALVLAIFATVAFGCGANETDPSDLSCPVGQIKSAQLSCYTPEPGTGSIITEPQGTGGTTGTTTSTDTGSGSTTGNTTSTQTSVTTTSTTTSTATNAPVNITLPDGQYCTTQTDPREAAAGGVMDLSGTWKMTTTDGKEIVLKVDVNTYGQATACGIHTDAASSKQPIHWKGVSTEKCIAWAPDTFTDPYVQGTGRAPDATGTTCIIGGNPNVKICRFVQTVPGCP